MWSLESQFAWKVLSKFRRCETLYLECAAGKLRKVCSGILVFGKDGGLEGSCTDSRRDGTTCLDQHVFSGVVIGVFCAAGQDDRRVQQGQVSRRLYGLMASGAGSGEV